ncbi:uncharacterized protein LOC100833739 isoform X2 [Brachypodium distachyon]|uniref:F-box domain-containing protein n=1 Tax=Brachypodium distachyon TaxID=15368 RepID=A0A0Q3GMW1_BRADI|nr:uncharacterized protein LOC100833739 isoform X2 [Brachypodium distachyon]XP_014757134.1 uncharacterized protein LOC100833739 isoform X2 [Brachypodium distachyon]XP_014757136.1 uncharacterized protein LOC100833739 isoform X2 [Brachypodium distachyon]XP_014757137.1 uncharacterized protein LOC100833739 isoform X2 [Brachypodium distachyon]XP_014757140.1 uncharacterized protein LOC100833739 isoform X2 [Brachypodium distachyon]KQK12374.1 hypothetical protein BRADI_1g03307v3 [Brachypodium distachy|eukprot:XP_014757131.1 uncharacterized protein LOC100833739 isoform X2 [Brachypodium distachyon]
MALRRDSPPALPDELIEEIFLRLPPDEPSCLLRASLVSKSWSRAVSGSEFRRRLHELHGTPPVLGVLHDWYDEAIPRFISTTASPFSLAAPDCLSWRALDCRHGRALFLSNLSDTLELLVWEPTTGSQWRIPVPGAFLSDFPSAAFKGYFPDAELEWRTPTAAVFCSADGCDHRDCLGGPFGVVFVFSVSFEEDTDHEEYLTSAGVYSSETGTWGELTLMHDEFGNYTCISSVLVGRSLLYFMSDGGAILEYDLAGHALAVFDTPHSDDYERFNLMLTKDGGLGVSESLHPQLKLWSREESGSTDARWFLTRVIYLDKLLPSAALINPEDSVLVLGFAEGANVIFMITVAGLFTIELHSERVKKVSTMARRHRTLVRTGQGGAESRRACAAVVPYFRGRGLCQR